MRWGQECMPAGACRSADASDQVCSEASFGLRETPCQKFHRYVLNVNDFGPHTSVDLFNVRRALLAQFESDAAQLISQFQSTSHDVGIDGKRASRRQVA